ncbi:MAG: sigma-70 family RNA polymerase sigma factor [candidate division Zixibacteria bacterium]|nr:sigma-70 family RNA polymerase sigma factor [candidate division Zixibacteria bacterium]
MDIVKTNENDSNVQQQTDKELVRKCKIDLPYNTEAFEILVSRYQNRVFAKVTQMVTGSVEDVEDVAQDIFMRVFSGLQDFHLKATFSTWLYAITVNACLSWIDKRKRQPWWWLTVDIDEIYSNTQEEEAVFALVGHSKERKFLRNDINSTLQQLDPSFREVLVLRYMDELDYRSIASSLKIGLSATKMRLKRAREAFKDKFAQVNHGEIYV